MPKWCNSSTLKSVIAALINFVKSTKMLRKNEEKNIKVYLFVSQKWLNCFFFKYEIWYACKHASLQWQTYRYEYEKHQKKTIQLWQGQKRLATKHKVYKLTKAQTNSDFWYGRFLNKYPNILLRPYCLKMTDKGDIHHVSLNVLLCFTSLYGAKTEKYTTKTENT